MDVEGEEFTNQGPSCGRGGREIGRKSLVVDMDGEELKGRARGPNRGHGG